MTPSTPSRPTPLAAVSASLATLLGDGLALDAEVLDDGAAGDPTAGRLVLAASTEAGEALFAVALDEGWAGVLSQAMLGETLPAAEAGDLLQEVAGQAYGAFRTQAGAEGPTPPAVLFAVAEAVPALPEPLTAVAFTWAREDDPLAGAVLFPSRVLQAAAPEAAAPEAAGPRDGGAPGHECRAGSGSAAG